MATKAFDEQLTSIDEQLARLKARKQASIARHGQDERKARNHACMVAGGLLLGCFPEGWQTIDWEGLASVVDRNEAIFGQRTAEGLPTPEASRRLRAWEQSQHDARSESNKEGNGGDYED